MPIPPSKRAFRGTALARGSRRLVATGALGTHHGLATTILGRSVGREQEKQERFPARPIVRVRSNRPESGWMADFGWVSQMSARDT
jgi:hypothetical protein